MLPLNTNIRLAYANGKDDEQNFIQNLSLFLCTFLKEHGQLIEKRLNLRETLMEVNPVGALFNKCSPHCINCIHGLILLFVFLTGPPLHAVGVRSGRDRDLQNLSGVLEPLGSWALQRESLLYLHFPSTLGQPALWRAPSQTALPACPLQGATHGYI